MFTHGYWARLLDCLREDYPTSRSALGEEAFDAFAVGYLQTYPSESYTLGKLGARFPQYLEETSPQGDGSDAWLIPLIELAEMERAVSDIFDAPGGETLGYLLPRPRGDRSRASDAEARAATDVSPAPFPLAK